MAADLPPSAARVQSALLAAGVEGRVVLFDRSTRTAEDAAAAIGCAVAQIAKSLVFQTKGSAEPVLVIASGAHRVDETAVARALAARIDGQEIARADAAFVRERTGYAIGGVPPIGRLDGGHVVLDRHLTTLSPIWAAAGTPFAVFRTEAETLLRLTGATLADIAKR